MTTIEFNYKLTGLQKHLEYFAKKLTNNNDDAQDLLQETFLKALTFKDKFADSTNLKAWLFTIMKNIFINNYRRNVRVKTIIDTSDNLYHINSSSTYTSISPESDISEKEILREIGNLSDDHRIPFEMHTHGFKYKEIAEELEISIGTVKSRIFFTRKKLMASLKDFNN
ncbi:MAG: RNA polymerase sigma factor [Bacteroidales bacterium]|nr:RNA polymerase sigma factor [Bacteroidales bacterium]